MHRVSQQVQIISILLMAVTISKPAALLAQTPHQQLPPQHGTSLFHFYQEKYFSAITDLLVAEQRQSLLKKSPDSALLLGGLYYYFDMPDTAEAMLRDSINAQTDPRILDRAWFNLGKMHYQHGNLQASTTLLSRHNGTLDVEQNAERLNLLSSIYLRSGQFASAEQILPQLIVIPVWQAYALFNTGVILANKGQHEAAHRTLASIQDIKSRDPEIKALKDKASLALAYSYIRLSQPHQAIETFNKIRIHGPLSNKALLGYGWAQFQLKQYEKALVAWSELKDRKQYDSAVQEALLAIPYTMEALKLEQQALDNYSLAIDSFTKQVDKLEYIISNVKNRSFISYLQPAYVREDSFLPEYARPVPENLSGPYLQSVFAQADFQQAHRTYHQLLHMQARFAGWHNQLPALELMISERNRFYKDKKQQINPAQYTHRVTQLINTRNSLEHRYQNIVQRDDYISLATPQEQEWLEALRAIGRKLSRQKNNASLADAREKHRIMTGLLHWQLNNEYPDRIWRIRKNLLKTDSEITRLHSASHSLQQALQKGNNLSGYSARIPGISARINDLQKRNHAAIVQYEDKLLSIINSHLQDQLQLVSNYQLRARYAYARLYDKLSHVTGSEQ